MNNQLYKKIKADFQTVPMLLYVGHSISDESLESIIKNPWSAIITSRTDDDFDRFLSSIKKKKKIIINGDTFPVEQLGGEYVFVFKPFLGDKTVSDYKAYYMLGKIVEKYLNNVSRLLIVGYDESDDKEFSYKNLLELFEVASEGSVIFWGANFDSTNSESNSDKIECHSETLESVLDEYSDDEDFSFNDVINPNDVFYSHNKPYYISEDDMLQLDSCSNTAILLSENKINKVRISGTLSYQNWFYNFINDSPLEGPQWYGYRTKSEFFVRRDYEQKLKRLIDRMLDNSSPNHIKSAGPVILSGYSCTSKTITLGALAYDYFTQKKNPVVFIKSSKLNISEGSYEINDLTNILRFIKDKANDDERIIIFWDSSGYRDVEKSARDLFDYLKGEGFRFVLVCSSYPKLSISNLTIRKDGEEHRLSDRTNLLYQLENCDYYFSGTKHLRYFVYATRIMDDNEIKSFWKKFREFSGLPNKTINHFKEQLDKNNNRNIFEYYYQTIMLLRQTLDKMILREERVFHEYIKDEFNAILNTPPKNEQKAQWQIELENWLLEHPEESEEQQDSKTEDNESAEYAKLDKLQITVAMFSKFNISLSYDTLCLLIKNEKEQNSYFSTDDRSMFDALTQIPFFSYSNTETEGFTFRYRSSLEAKVFLNRKDKNGEIQLSILLELLDLLKIDAQSSGIYNNSLAICLREFLKLSGPNSKKYFSEDIYWNESDDYYKFFNNIPSILDKISELLKVLERITDKVGFIHTFITFTREYYGNSDYCNNIDERIEHLKRAFSIAQEAIEEIEIFFNGFEKSAKIKSYLNDEYQAIVTESAFTYSKISELEENCNVKFCSSGIFRSAVFPYLKKIIILNPTNGYAYNALFKNFLKMYKEEKNEGIKRAYWNEMMGIIDDSEGYEIVNRGDNKDDLTEYIKDIYKCRNNSINIDMILDRENQTDVNTLKFLKNYDGWLEANNPTAIISLCREELISQGISGVNSEQEFIMTTYKKGVCQKVIDFMERDENKNAIKSTRYSLEFLIKVYWLLFNGTHLVGSRDRQLTKLTKNNWETILKLCEDYSELQGDDEKPIIGLIYSLSLIQSKSDYKQASKILSTIRDNKLFWGMDRSKTPFMICDEKGVPVQFSGCSVYQLDKDNDKVGYLRVPGIPLDLGESRKGVYFKIRNFGKGINMPKENDFIEHSIEIGIGYSGLSAYTKKGRRDWGDKE